MALWVLGVHLHTKDINEILTKTQKMVSPRRPTHRSLAIYLFVWQWMINEIPETKWSAFRYIVLYVKSCRCMWRHALDQEICNKSEGGRGVNPTCEVPSHLEASRIGRKNIPNLESPMIKAISVFRTQIRIIHAFLKPLLDRDSRLSEPWGAYHSMKMSRCSYRVVEDAYLSGYASGLEDLKFDTVWHAARCWMKALGLSDLYSKSFSSHLLDLIHHLMFIHFHHWIFHSHSVLDFGMINRFAHFWRVLKISHEPMHQCLPGAFRECSGCTMQMLAFGRSLLLGSCWAMGLWPWSLRWVSHFFNDSKNAF